MKIFMLLTLLATSASVFAFHPEEGDIISKIGIGSKIIALSDINLKPNTGEILFGGNECAIIFKEENFDRVIKSGTEFTVSSVRSGREDSMYIFDPISEKILNVANARQIIKLNNLEKKLTLNCDISFNRPNKTKPTTIGELKKYFAGVFKVELAEPKQY